MQWRLMKELVNIQTLTIDSCSPVRADWPRSDSIYGQSVHDIIQAPRALIVYRHDYDVLLEGYHSYSTWKETSGRELLPPR